MISEQIGFDLLRLFVAVCRQGSLSRVAAQTGRTQSALSMQMRRLEELLDRQLFQRTGRGVVPTAEGELFLGYATRMLALGDEAAARLKVTELSGAVRIGLAEEVAHAALPPTRMDMLGHLHRAYPDIRLDLAVEHSVALGRLWRDGGLDILIAPTSVVAADAITTWNVELHWVAAAGYEMDPAQPIDIVTFGDSEGAPPCLWRRRMIEALTAIGREHRVTLTSQSVTALQAAIESGLGVGALPSDSIRAASMRILKPSAGIPAPLTVQYGLYTPDRRTKVVEAVTGVLLESLPLRQAA